MFINFTWIDRWMEGCYQCEWIYKERVRERMEENEGKTERKEQIESEREKE